MRCAMPILIVLALTLSGCIHSTEDGPVVVITASYPGADAQTVADTVAAPIEQQVNGTEQMIDIESESRSDGSYTARVRFRPNADPNLIVTLIQNRVAMATPVLPDAVKRGGVPVVLSAQGQGNPNRATIVLMDRSNHGWDPLRGFSEAVVKRISADGAMLKPEAFPGPDAKHVHVDLDRAKCAKYGVAIADALKVVDRTGVKIEALNAVHVSTAKGEKIPITSVATLSLVSGPAAVYRFNLYPAVRITGTAPQGRSAASAASRCAELAEEERKNQKDPGGFTVMPLTAR